MTLTSGTGGEKVIGNAFVGSIAFDGSSMEASVHWLDKPATGRQRPYDVFSLRVATGHPFAVDLAEFQDCYRKFANFLDWLLAVRVARLKQIQKLPDYEPNNAELRANEDHGDEAEVIEGEREGSRPEMEPTSQEDEQGSTSHTQSIQNLLLQSFDGPADSLDLYHRAADGDGDEDEDEDEDEDDNDNDNDGGSNRPRRAREQTITTEMEQTTSKKQKKDVNPS